MIMITISHHDHHDDDNFVGRQYGAGTEVPIKSLLGHRSQAPPEVEDHHYNDFNDHEDLQYYDNHHKILQFTLPALQCQPVARRR